MTEPTETMHLEQSRIGADGADGADSSPPDLTAIERDLAAVEAALSALDDGSYWVDEVTGEPIPDEVLAANPVARRV